MRGAELTGPPGKMHPGDGMYESQKPQVHNLTPIILNYYFFRHFSIKIENLNISTAAHAIRGASFAPLQHILWLYV